MSGLEIAGLLVGAFPLVVSALEHYHETHKALLRVDAEYRKTLADVKYEQLVFRLVLEQLLFPLCAGESFCEGELEELLQNPNGTKLSHQRVADVAEDRLGRTHDRFIEIAHSLNSTICRLLVTLVTEKPRLQARIREELSPNSSDVSSWKQKLSMTAFQTFMKKQLQYRKEQVEFGLGKPQREDLIRQIHQDNKKLEKLMDKSEKIASLRTSRTVAIPPKAVKSLLQYWHHADEVYALVSQFWECTCRQRHCAHLWLQHRESSTFEFKFLVLWAPHEHTKQQLPPWDRQGLRVTLMRADEAKVESQVAVCAQPSVSSLRTITTVPPGGSSLVPQKKRKVGFIDLERYLKPVVPQSLSSKDSNKTAPIAHTSDTAPTDMLKLCEAMSSCGMQAALLGSMGNRTAGGPYSVHSDPEQKVAGDGTCLQDILHGTFKTRPKRSVRFQIALAIASSHLQLRSTSWARKQWEACDIFFPRTGDTTSPFMFDKPYVSADFENAAPKPAQIPKKTDRSFGCLGIMLLELLFGSSVNDHELWQTPGFDGNQTSPLFRIMVARQWADSVEGEAGPEFSAAVMWCLNESPMTLSGDQWRRDLANRVVLPLERCYKCFEQRQAT